MNQLHILCIEDEHEVRDAILRDLSSFEYRFALDSAGDAIEAEEIISNIESRGERIALIYCDHILPGECGVEFLTRLKTMDLKSLEGTKKALFTGQAGHSDTIHAINEGGIHHYLEKPWKAEDLQSITRDLLTDFVLAQKVHPLPYMSILDTARLSEAIHNNYTINEAG